MDKQSTRWYQVDPRVHCGFGAQPNVNHLASVQKAFRTAMVHYDVLFEC